MEHFGEFSDYDEGRDFDPREAFFTEAVPCHSCGQPCDELRRAEWDSDLLVGECCFQNASIPDVPACPQMIEVIKNCSLVSSVQEAMEAHRECCDVCSVPMRKEAGREAAGRKERVA
jgi:hypothetical protein